MIGTSWIRDQHLKDPLLVEMLRVRGLDRVPSLSNPRANAKRARWDDLAALRDGPVNPDRVDVADPAAMAAEVKRLARALGADDVGATQLRPEYVRLGVELPHDTVIAIICYEDYAKALDGAAAVEFEAMSAYVKGAEIATEIARHIRENLGYAAVAHHNGKVDVQAIPIMQQVGFGELGKHGSLIHREYGANFRPGFVTTTLPLAADSPVAFGVQDYCMSCNLCTNNCPADAIPADYIMTEGVKRWLTDIEKCYTVSRLRPEYCHICVDVCPYIQKLNRDPEKRDIYRRYMRGRKEAGYKTPKSNAPTP
jgi:ferredoxin